MNSDHNFAGASKLSLPFIPHERALTAERSVLQCVARARPGEFVWLVAPSWSGKSELRRRLLPVLAGNPAYWPAGGIPLISVRAVLNNGDKFNPKDFALRLHQEITEPEVGWLADGSGAGSPDRFHEAAEQRAALPFWTETRRRMPERELRLSFERMSKVRGLKYIIVDEVANFCRVAKSQSARNYMLGVMALIEEIGCVGIMLGTHEASPLYENAQEILNRSEVVYMRPYDVSDRADLEAYATLIKAVGCSFPLDSGSLLQENLELIVLNGGGIFGPTLRYLRRANEVRCREGCATLKASHLILASGSARTHSSFWADIDAFNLVANASPATKLSDFVKIRQRSSYSSAR
ncbi:hypothetical protein [Stenotrophomonas sp.]|uniref:hypothetical protein n=1 Tax=Stenotrophomonas sp. TaxID=69392 RepID=UPI0028AEEEE9|nr:hypothetical protein [Stenotrophomonas sp.]